MVNEAAREPRTYYHGSPRDDLDKLGLRKGSYITDDKVWASMHGNNLYSVEVPSEDPVMQYWTRNSDGADVVIVERDVPANRTRKTMRPWTDPRFILYELKNFRSR